MTWAIMLTWLGMAPIIGDGTYNTKHDCEAFIEFVAYDGIAAYSEETGYLILEDDGKGFTAKCVQVDHKK